jgi:hypothetical protein
LLHFSIWDANYDQVSLSSEKANSFALSERCFHQSDAPEEADGMNLALGHLSSLSRTDLLDIHRFGYAKR